MWVTFAPSDTSNATGSGRGFGAVSRLRTHSRTSVSANTVTPMLLWVCVRLKRTAGLWTSCTMDVPRPSIPMTSTALIQWMSRNGSGHAPGSSFICQGARLHGEFDRVINQGQPEDHAEIRTLDHCGRRESNRAPSG